MVPACGGNFVCETRKSLHSAVCLLITATCAPNKGGDLFSSLSGRAAQESFTAQGALGTWVRFLYEHTCTLLYTL